MPGSPTGCPLHFLIGAVGGQLTLVRPPWIIRQHPGEHLLDPVRLRPVPRRRPARERAEPLPRPGGREFLPTDLAGNGRKTRAHSFSRTRAPRIDTHPAFLVFDHGPGRQGGRSTISLSTLLGRDRGRDEHRTTQPCQAALSSALRSLSMSTSTSLASRGARPGMFAISTRRIRAP